MKFFDWKCPNKKCGTEGTNPDNNETTHCPFCGKEVMVTRTLTVNTTHTKKIEKNFGDVLRKLSDE